MFNDISVICVLKSEVYETDQPIICYMLYANHFPYNI